MHTSPITCIGCCQDGRLITGGYDGKVTCWNSEFESVWQSQLPDLINCIQISFDQELVYVAAADGYAYALAVRDGFIVMRYGPHLDDVNFVSCHPWSGSLVTVCDAKDATTRVWNSRSGVEERVLPSRPDGTFQAKLSASGNSYATTGGDGTVRLYSFETGQELHRLVAQSSAEAIAWVGVDEDQLLSGHSDGTIILWNVPAKTQLRTFQVAKSTIRCLECASDGKLILAGGYDGRMCLLDGTTWQLVRTLETPFQWERSALLANGRIYVGSFAGRPIAYSDSGALISIPAYEHRTLGINTFEVDSSGTVYLAGDSGAIVRFSRLQGHAELYQGETIINTTLLVEQLELLVLGDYHGKITAIDLRNGAIIAQGNSRTGPINCLAFDASRSAIVSGGYDGVVRFWSPMLNELSSVSLHVSPCKTIQCVHEHDTVLVGSSNGHLAAIVKGGDHRNIVVPHAEVLNDIAVCPRLGIFVTVSRDHVIRVWELGSLSHVESLPCVHTKSIKTVDIDPSTGAVLTGSYDGSVILWRKSSDVWTWKRLVTGAKPGVSKVRFLADGTLCAASWDGKLRRWSKDGELQGVIEMTRTILWN